MPRGKSHHSSTRPSRSHPTRAYALVAVLAIAVLALVGVVVTQQNSRQTALADVQQPSQTPLPKLPTMNPVTPKLQPSDVLPRLEDPERPFNIVMFGDSTGVSKTGWHTFFAEWIGEKYDRPSIIHPWDGTPGADQYQDAVWTMTEGDNASVEIWNASVSSTKSDYPMTRFDVMVPIPAEAVDMVMINYGHNHTAGGLTSEGGLLAREVVERYPNAAVIGFLQNAERYGSPHSTDLTSANITWEQWLKRNQFFYVDIETPFKEAADLDAILSDDGDIHPNTEGYELWAEVLIAALEEQ